MKLGIPDELNPDPELTPLGLRSVWDRSPSLSVLYDEEFNKRGIQGFTNSASVQVWCVERTRVKKAREDQKQRWNGKGLCL